MQAAVAVGREHGLHVGEPVVIADSSNTLVHLRPAPVVARVATGTGPFRPGDAWLAREVEVCTHLASAGVPAVRPSDELPPGPHTRDGLALSFWRLLELTGAPVDAAAAATALREVHLALEGFPGELPPLLALDDVERMASVMRSLGLADEADAALLERSARRARSAVAGLGLPLQAVHGDAHLGNAVSTKDGPVWTDFEDAFLGPVGWDLACLVEQGRIGGRDPAPGEAALAAYGSDAIDPDALDVLVQARGVQIAAWTLALASRVPHAEERAALRMSWLRALEA